MNNLRDMSKFFNMLWLEYIFLIKIVSTTVQNGFPKDLDTNIDFPPILERRNGIPTGHLRPFGWQNRPQDSVPEQSPTLKPEAFWDTYVNHSDPMVVRGLVFGSTSLDKWSDSYLSHQYGHLDIKVTRRKQQFSHAVENSTQMSFDQFLTQYRVEDLYMRVIMPKEMQTEAPMPHIVNCGPLVSSNNTIKLAQLSEAFLWMSAGETSSLLHSHPENNLHCVLEGRKDFILMPTDQFTSNTVRNAFDNEENESTPWRERLDLYETYPHSSEWYSKIDVDMVNAFKYSALQKMIWYWSSLRAGDCIYIPGGYLHQVRSYGRSISSSVYFASYQTHLSRNFVDELKTKLFMECAPNSPSFTSMNLYAEHFVWTYTHGERHLNKREHQQSDAVGYLLYLMGNVELLYFERFDHFYEQITKEFNKDSDLIHALKSADIWRQFLAENSTDQFLNRMQINELTAGNLENFIQILNKAATLHETKTKAYKDEL